MSTDKPIITLNALVGLGLDEASAARVVRAVTNNASAIQKRLDQLNATKAQKSMDLWASAVQEAGGVAKLTSSQTTILANELEKLAKAGAKVPTSLQPAIESMKKLQAEEARAADLAQARQQVMDKVSIGGVSAGELAGAGPAVAVLAAGAAMAGVAKQTYDLIAATSDHADEISDLGKQYQISTDAVQQFQFMAARTGKTVDDFGGAIVNITKNLDEAPEKFTRWGMSVEHLKSLKPEELLGAMADRLETLNESDRLTFAKELLKGTELLPVLVDGFTELSAKAKEIGVPFTEKEVADLSNMREVLDDIGTGWDEMWLQLGGALAADPQIQEFFANLRDGVNELAAAIRENKTEIAGFAKLLLGIGTFNVSRASSGALNLLGFENVPTVAPPPPGWRMPGVKDTSLFSAAIGGFSIYGQPGGGKASQHAPDPAAVRAAEAERKKAEEDALARIERAIEARRKYVEAQQAVNEAEAAHASLLREQLKLDPRGSMTTDVIKSLDAGNPSRTVVSDSSGPTLPREISDKLLAATGLKAISDAIEKDKERERINAIIEAQLKAQGKSQEEIDKALGRTVSKGMSWSQFLQVAANQFASMGQTGAAVSKIAGGVAGIGSMFEKGGALEGGVGKIFSGGLKGLAGGATAALAAFDMGKVLYSMFHKTEAQKVAFDVGRDYGVKISEGLSKEIANNSKTMGREAASLLSLDKIIGEAGGVQAFGVDKTIGKMRDLFSMIQTGKMTAEQAKKPFDALFGEVAQASISKTTGLISTQARAIMSMGIDAGMNGADSAIVKFQNEQFAIAETILNRLADNKAFVPASESAAQAFGGALAAQYRAMVEKGLSGAEIAEKLGPEIDKIQAKLAEAGFGGGEQFDAIVGKVAMFRDELTGPTAQAISDVTSLAVALYNSGDLTRDQFAGLANQVGADFTTLQKQLAEQGGDPSKAYANMAGDLQKLWEMQRRYGVTLDEQTQSILTQAEANGTVGEAQMSAQDRMAEGIDRLNVVMQRVGEQLGASFDDLPARAKTAAQGVGDALAGIRPPEIDLTGKMNLPADMGAYGSGGVAGDLTRAIEDLGQATDAQDIGGSVGEAITPGLEALAEGMVGLAGQPVQTTTIIRLEDGSIAASLTNSVDRGGPAGQALLTALAAKLKGKV